MKSINNQTKILGLREAVSVKLVTYSIRNSLFCYFLFCDQHAKLISSFSCNLQRNVCNGEPREDAGSQPNVSHREQVHRSDTNTESFAQLTIVTDGRTDIIIRLTLQYYSRHSYASLAIILIVIQLTLIRLLSEILRHLEVLGLRIKTSMRPSLTRMIHVEINH